MSSSPPALDAGARAADAIPGPWAAARVAAGARTTRSASATPEDCRNTANSLPVRQLQHLYRPGKSPGASAPLGAAASGGRTDRLDGCGQSENTARQSGAVASQVVPALG